jgi:hypothetical protein
MHASLLDGMNPNNPQLMTYYHVDENERGSYKHVDEHRLCPIAGPCTERCQLRTFRVNIQNQSAEADEVNTTHAGDLYDGCNYFYGVGPPDQPGFAAIPHDEEVIVIDENKYRQKNLRSIQTFLRVG